MVDYHWSDPYPFPSIAGVDPGEGYSPAARPPPPPPPPPFNIKMCRLRFPAVINTIWCHRVIN